ncbi:uncharacterized protein LOC110202689 [Phascolarctos cinereus]|uniref:Uncharacterized protein LOC110202689 n=1 Tax=Phascolarctos cinereus TaxID=38626 RepID=A0A6P5JK82_PHACI|nr:uncharacterized protein LOC110202689 [Phascolarctos cinereus]XP_020834615.1 uncharacterized protein LOC110202689 [Phascolarctos cinereus]
MSSTPIFLPGPQQDISDFWTDQETMFPDGANQLKTLTLTSVAHQSQTLPQHSYPLSRVNTLHACPEPKGSENDSEEGITYALDHTAMPADEEKMLLLHKNIELQRLNKQLMKLNQEWNHMYHVTTFQMQQKMSILQMEVVDFKQQAERLTIQLDQEQNKKEYYEQGFLQELEKNLQLQEYVRHLENKLQQNHESCPMVNFMEGYGASPILLTRKHLQDDAQCWHGLGNAKVPKTIYCRHQLDISNSEREMTDLINQMEALKCQTEMLEANSLTERMKVENENLCKKEEEMRQQMALLQEQLKTFEDDFRKDCTDKHIFQSLLNKSHGRSPTTGACEYSDTEKFAASSTATSTRPKSGGCKPVSSLQ